MWLLLMLPDCWRVDFLSQRRRTHRSSGTTGKKIHRNQEHRNSFCYFQKAWKCPKGDTSNKYFYTFTSWSKSHQLFVQVVRDHNWNCCRLFSQPPESSLSRLLQPYKWSVRYAPPPEDIYWENITNSHTLYVLKAVAVNIFVSVAMSKVGVITKWPFYTIAYFYRSF